MTRGGKRPGAGRKAQGDAATEHLHIRVSAGRLDAYREASARSELPLSEWVQRHLDAAASVRPASDARNCKRCLGANVYEYDVHGAVVRAPCYHGDDK